MANEVPVQLLWTGGWDSTYRLLELLLDKRLPVEPTYLVDSARASAPCEIDAMDRIRAALAERFPHTRTLLLPSHLVRLENLKRDDEIQRAFDRIASTHRFGNQYGFLSRYCQQKGLDGVELLIEMTAHGAYTFLKDEVVETITPQGYTTWRLRPDCPDADLRTVIGPFALPGLMTKKQETSEAAARNGWTDLLEMTWFCHSPRGGQPCGLCNPCQYAMEQGFDWRIPRRRRALSKLYRYTLMPLRVRTRQWLRRFRATG
ncbi:hypothetical protein LVB87_11845 [Lysobacter sp. KIS68-7]|uniref:hypothetical protein n=1 Tax=Lysobacter sp. KIS68-7 TaxID=2904252 RepID=UPI001E620F58|nr:hypothetical protein [Lysobacter sp. KIS68-7]UHQ18873.1 hypothetical protein LVB87_11845 [Lysobacter sp. KIS68-7]